jgi:glycosyltransferase involved in cell wall biosynthesis
LQKYVSISVVIPTYNRANDLVIAIKSVLKQTYPVTEILVCDDGSTDNSKELVTAINNPKVKWIDCGKNGGPAIPRNIGIKHSQGDWVAFLDSDDEWKAEKLEKQVAAIEKYHVLASCANASRIRFGEDKGAFSDFSSSKVTLKDLMLKNSIICSSVLINKQLLLDISLFPEEKKFIAIEDYALWLRVSTQTDFAFVNENLIKYLDNVETSIRTTYSDSWVIFDIIFSDFKNWIKEKNIKLTKEQKSDFNKLLKKIKNKGIPTATDEFFRKLSDKLGVKTRYNS